MSNQMFHLKKAHEYDMFANTDKPLSNVKIVEIAIENLVPFHNHPFKLYTGQRLADMVESIKENGIITPITVRPLNEDNAKYEILAGHNRCEGGKLAGIETIPCYVREGLSEDEAMLIVTETNLIQRSFADIRHSERATILYNHYEATKKQGKRTDFISQIKEIENSLLNDEKAYDNSEKSTSAPMVQKLETRDKLAQEYGLNRGTIARYIRIYKLISSFKEKIDNEELSLRAGVSLSYLSEEQQQRVVDFIDVNGCRVDIKKAEQLREYAEIDKLNDKALNEIFLGTKSKVTSSKPSTVIKIKRKKYERFFNGNESQTEIEETLEKALAFYFEFKDNADLMVAESAAKVDDDDDFDLDRATSE